MAIPADSQRRKADSATESKALVSLLGGMPAAEPPKEVDNCKMIDLLDKIDKQDTYAKNESASFPMTNLFIGDSRLGCKSDADEQLILHISFQEFVKVWRV